MTPKQQTVYNSIRALIDKHGVSPTMREVAAHAGMTESAVRPKIHSLRRLQMITMVPNSRRSIRLVERTKKAATHVSPDRHHTEALRLRIERLEKLVSDLISCRSDQGRIASHG